MIVVIQLKSFFDVITFLLLGFIVFEIMVLFKQLHFINFAVCNIIKRT